MQRANLRRRRWGPPWALLSIPVVIGGVIMWLGGASAASWSGHIAAGVVGILVYAVVTRMRETSSSRMMAMAMAIAGTLALLATLMAPDLEGVRRWLVLGPVRLHASALVMPALLVLVACYGRSWPMLAPALLLTVQGIHFLQPDAGQATAVAAAVVVLLIGNVSGARANASAHVGAFVGAFVGIALAAATWVRADPLSAAPFVEDIVGRAFGIAPWAGCLALASLAPVLVAPSAARGDAAEPGAATAARALTVYFATTMLVTIFGQFPVPMLGFGASPVLGAFLGVAVLRRL